MARMLFQTGETEGWKLKPTPTLLFLLPEAQQGTAGHRSTAIHVSSRRSTSSQKVREQVSVANLTHSSPSFNP